MGNNRHGTGTNRWVIPMRLFERIRPNRTFYAYRLNVLGRGKKVVRTLLANPLHAALMVLVNPTIRFALLLGPGVRKDHRNPPIRVLLTPYDYPPTRVLHAILAAQLKKLGHHASLETIAELNDKSGADFPGLVEFTDEVFNSVDDAIEYLHSLGEGDEILSTAIIDEFVRYCEVSFFKADHVVPASFQEKVFRTKQRARKLASSFDVAVVGDSSYLANGAIISQFLDCGGRVFAADFIGTFREITRIKSERRNRDFFYTELREIQRQPNPTNETDELVEAFLSARYRGLGSDPEVAIGFRDSDLSGYPAGKKKKVLFLHSFRDANGQVASAELGASLFRTYFQWADAALAIVAESPTDWVVKSHPSFARLAGDLEILSHLLEKHRIPPAIVDPGISSGFVLRNRWPVFTHDGTIAREAATFGYKAVSVSVHLPDEITSRITSVESFNSWYRLPPPEVNREQLDEATILAAKRMFFDHVRPGLQVVVRKTHQRPVGSSLYRYLLPSRICLTLAMKFMTKPGRAEISNVALRLVGSSP